MFTVPGDDIGRSYLKAAIGNASVYLIMKDKETGQPVARPGREEQVEKLRGWVQDDVERLYKPAELK